MRKLIVALGMTTAVCLTSAAVAFADGAPPPVQAATQSATTSQQAAALSSAQQVQPSNVNVSIRINSPGDDGDVTQTNSVGSTANAGNQGVDGPVGRPDPGWQRRAVVAAGCRDRAGRPGALRGPAVLALEPERPDARLEPRRRRLHVAVEHRQYHGQRRERRGDGAGRRAVGRARPAGAASSGGRRAERHGPSRLEPSRPQPRPRRPVQVDPRTRTSRFGSTALAMMETSPRPTR